MFVGYMLGCSLAQWKLKVTTYGRDPRYQKTKNMYLPETNIDNIASKKIDGWNITFLLVRPIFRGEHDSFMAGKIH